MSTLTAINIYNTMIKSLWIWFNNNIHLQFRSSQKWTTKITITIYIDWIYVRHIKMVECKTKIAAKYYSFYSEYLTEQLRYVGEVLDHQEHIQMLCRDLYSSVRDWIYTNWCQLTWKNETNMNTFRKKTVNFIKHIYFWSDFT